MRTDLRYTHNIRKEPGHQTSYLRYSTDLELPEYEYVFCKRALKIYVHYHYLIVTLVT